LLDSFALTFGTVIGRGSLVVMEVKLHESPVVEGGLFGIVIVVLVASGSLAVVKAEGIGRIRVVGEEVAGQAVDRRSGE
jgi:hypothetical protein